MTFIEVFYKLLTVIDADALWGIHRDTRAEMV
jgi:hypothetical protein